MSLKVETAVYRVNLHCHQCACEIRKPLLRTDGVHQVDFDLEKNEVKVKGSIDAVAIHKRIQRLSNRKVEMIAPVKGNVKEAVLATDKKDVAKETKVVIATEKKVVAKETKEVAARTIHIKAYMHCDQCERDLRTKLLRHRGIFSVKTDMKSQTLTVQGIIENDKLLRYIQNRVNKRAEIFIPPPPKAVEKAKVVVEKTKVAVEEIKTAATSSTVEFKEEKKVEVKTVEGNPYFIHYVYAPQIFSDENPNACSVM